MAKKIVRGITDVKTINNQDFDTNNVNDLLSDGQYNYIHRKKGKNEEYHNLTDNIKTISSDNTELLSVTNNNKTTNTATLHPKHDAQKEQVLKSTRSTITINHGTNGTDEKTTVDTNPQKVLEHENLISSSQYVTIEHEEDSSTSEIKTDKLDSKLNELDSKIPKSIGTVNLFKGSRDFSGTNWVNNSNGEYVEEYQDVKIYKTQTVWLGRTQCFEVKTGEEYAFSAYVKSSIEHDRIGFHLVHTDKHPQASGRVSFEALNEQDTVKFSISDEYKRITIKIKITKDGWIMPRLERDNNEAFLFFGGYKLERGQITSDWSPAPEDIYPLLSQKQDKLTAGEGITIQGNTISATGAGGGETSTIQGYGVQSETAQVEVIKHTVTNAYNNGITSGRLTISTYVFDFHGEPGECVVTGELKEELEHYVRQNQSVSNGTLKLTNDGTNIKLINSVTSQDTWVQGTFTFNLFIPDGGGGD